MRLNIKKTDALLDFLCYKRELKKKVSLMGEDEFMDNPIGFEIYGYIDRLLDYYDDKEMDLILKNQDLLMSVFGI